METRNFAYGDTMGRFKVVLVVGLVILSGCSGLLGPDESTPTATETVMETPTATPTETPTPTPTEQEREYVESGETFNRIIEVRVDENHDTRVVSSTAHRNNTVALTVRLTEDDVLYSGMMDVAETVAVTTAFRTTPNETGAMSEGTEGWLHRPEMVFVTIENSSGDRLGTFRIDPEQANAYRVREISPGTFAQGVVNTLETEQSHERGERSPGWYLNQSSLVDFANDYVVLLRNQTDPANSSFTREFPIDDITLDPGDMQLHHEIHNWSVERYGQASISAEAAIYGTYWRATDRSWAMPPDRVSIYIHRVDGDDLKGYMDNEAVFRLLRSNRDSQNLTRYLNSAEFEFVEDGE